MELRVEELFDISMSDENILSSEIQVIDFLGFDILYAEIVVDFDRKEDVFGYYLHFERDTDLIFLPRTIIERMLPGYEVDYFHLFLRSRQGGPAIISVPPRTHFVVFMQERNGTILVILYSDLCCGEWWRWWRCRR